MILQLAKKTVPASFRPKIKGFYFDLTLFLDQIRGIDHGMIPPTRMNFVGTKDDFLEVGKEFLEHFKAIGKLQANESVLDIGCGIGRMAIPLTEYLEPKARYEGFDIIPFGIKWCQQRIHPRHRNFNFTHADILNTAYNPGGTVLPEQFRFPYGSNSFDFAFATSVFTHLVQASAENYFKELQRVLKPGGRALITFFLLNDFSRKAVAERKADYLFDHPIGAFWTTDLASPEWAIALDEQWLATRLKDYGLAIDGPIHFGRWCKRENPTSYQDLVLIRKL